MIFVAVYACRYAYAFFYGCLESYVSLHQFVQLVGVQRLIYGVFCLDSQQERHQALRLGFCCLLERRQTSLIYPLWPNLIIHHSYTTLYLCAQTLKKKEMRKWPRELLTCKGIILSGYSHEDNLTTSNKQKRKNKCMPNHVACLRFSPTHR